MPDRRFDYLTEEGANSLARKIEQYWRGLGCEKVMVAVIPVVGTSRYGATVWGIKSNIGLSGPPI